MTIMRNLIDKSFYFRLPTMIYINFFSSSTSQINKRDSRQFSSKVAVVGWVVQNQILRGPRVAKRN